MFNDSAIYVRINLITFQLGYTYITKESSLIQASIIHWLSVTRCIGYCVEYSALRGITCTT